MELLARPGIPGRNSVLAQASEEFAVPGESKQAYVVLAVELDVLIVAHNLNLARTAKSNAVTVRAENRGSDRFSCNRVQEFVRIELPNPQGVGPNGDSPLTVGAEKRTLMDKSAKPCGVSVKVLQEKLFARLGIPRLNRAN